MINSFMLKTFVFDNQITSQSSTLQIPVYMNCQAIDIEQIIYFFKQINSISDKLTFKVYDPIINSYAQLNVSEGLARHYLIPPIVLLKYRAQIQINQENQYSKEDNTPEQEKKQRNKERSIRQVLLCVKKWRQTHNTLTKSKTKINLQQAAKIVGIAKKSLDDYYSQLRLAEKYGFDFDKNIDKKIGVLRLFVKNHRQKDSFNIKYQKLPKKLKIIQQHQLEQKQSSKLKIETQKQRQETILESQQGKYQKIRTNTECQKHFYRSFNFMLDDPQNPFNRYNNQTKTTQEQKKQQQFLLF